MGRTGLDDHTYARCADLVRRFLAEEHVINNRGLRRLTGLNYDQAIKFFARAVAGRVLIRIGSAGGTHYIRGPEDQ